MALFLGSVPDANSAVLEKITQIYEEDKDIFLGLMERLSYLRIGHADNSDIVISGVRGLTAKDVEFGILWFKKKDDGSHPQNRDEDPFMVGGLIHHGDGRWGIHT